MDEVADGPIRRCPSTIDVMVMVITQRFIAGESAAALGAQSHAVPGTSAASHCAMRA